MPRFEIEQKYRIDSPAKIRKVLKQLKARKLFSKKEFNELYDRKSELFKKGSALRLRHYGKDKALLTFKGATLRGPYKKRIEWETPVERNSTQEILRHVGFKKRAAYQKKREEYKVGKAVVTLDYLKGHGWFVEIEASPSEIRRLENQMGLKAKDREEKTYVEMVS